MSMSIICAMAASGCFSAFTLWPSTSVLVAGIIMVLLCALSRIDWRNNTHVHTTKVPVSTGIETDTIAVDTSSAQLITEKPPSEHVDVDEKDTQDDPYPTFELFHSPILDTPFESGSGHSRSSSMSRTTSLFDEQILNDRASTPDTEISDDENFPKSVAKNGNEAIETASSFTTSPVIPSLDTPSQPLAAPADTTSPVAPSLDTTTQSLPMPADATSPVAPSLDMPSQSLPMPANATSPVTPSLDTPSQPLPTPADAVSNHEAVSPPPVVAVTKYSMKPTDLVGAVEDFSTPMTVTPPRASDKITKSHTSTDHIVDPLLLFAKKRTAPSSTPVSTPANKKQKKLSPRRRRQAERLLGNSSSPLASGQ